jgi:hypothetical protein
MTAQVHHMATMKRKTTMIGYSCKTSQRRKRRRLMTRAWLIDRASFRKHHLDGKARYLQIGRLGVDPLQVAPFQV